MTREEYLKELDENLISLPKEERDMAVSFYSEYFDDAGPENEQATIDELGKPYNLARSIIGETSAYSKSEAYLKYKESKPMPRNSTGVFASLQKPDAFQNFDGNPKQNAVPEDTAEDVMPRGAENTAGRNTYEQDVQPNNNTGAGMFDDYYRNGSAAEAEDAPPPPPAKNDKNKMDTWLLVLLIIIGVLVGIPMLCGIIPLILAVIVTMLAIGIVSVVFLIASVIVFISGLIQFFVSVPRAIGFIFASALTAGIGLMLLSVSILFFFKLLPWSIKSIIKLLGKRRTA